MINTENNFYKEKNKKHNKLEVFFMLFFAFSIICLFIFIFVFLKYGQNLPDYNKLAKYKPPVTSRFYSGDGNLLIEYATEQRIFVELKDIPANLQNAFIAAEDKNFWYHQGIDFSGIFRSIFVNIKNKITGNRNLVGASTITQQVAKNFFLTSEQTFVRKIKEIILSLKMERSFSKRHILTLYFNQIFLGFRSYGVAAAALNYFNKPLSKLTLGESAFLAALPKAPNNYNPIIYKERAIDRRNWVLKRMQKDGYITKQEMISAQNEDLQVSENFISENQKYSLYFSEEVRKNLSSIYGEEQLYSGGLTVYTTINPKYQKIATLALKKAVINFDEKNGWRGAEKNINIDDEKWLQDEAIVKKLQNSNQELWQILLKNTVIYSGFEDEGWKKAIILNVNQNSAEIGFTDGSKGIINLDNSWTKFIKRIKNDDGTETTKTFKITYMREMVKKGDIVFVIKNYDNYFTLKQVPEINGAIVIMNPHTGQVYAMVGGFSYARSKFNRATQAFRQPGSTVKPFIYLTAFEQGYHPASSILDAPVVMEKGDGSLWRPENYNNTFTGEMTVRRALEQSKNNPAVRMANMVGLRNFIKTAENFGVYKAVKNPNLSMALGSGDTTLIDLTSAFGKLINGGFNIEPFFVDRVQDRNGVVIYKNDNRECLSCNDNWNENLTPPELNITKKQLADSKSIYQIVNILQGAVERGSGWKARIDGKTICGKTGTSNDQKDVWFIGGTPDLVAGVFIGYDNPKSLGDYMSGGSLATPIFKDFMSEILQDTKDRPFPLPNDMVMLKVDKDKGCRVSSGDNTNTVLEVFKQENLSSLKDCVVEGQIDKNTSFDGIY